MTMDLASGADEKSHTAPHSSPAFDERYEVWVMVAKIGCIIFSIEAAIMVVMSLSSSFAIPFFQDLLDATTLTIIASPIIYYGVARPFSNAAREAREEVSRRLAESKRLLEQNEALRGSLQKANEATAEAHEQILRRVSAELHDGPAQLLTFSLLQLRRLEPVAEVARERNVNVDLDKVIEVTNDAMREIRAISTGLSLPELANYTLAEAIALAVRRHGELTGDKVTTSLSGLPVDVPLSYKICAYRFVQEALTNAHRHSSTRHARIDAIGEPNVAISVADDGKGFDTTKPGAGLGVPGMRARLEALGGHVDVASTVGRGTTITARFAPLHASAP